jgi:hypothetical protein
MAEEEKQEPVEQVVTNKSRSPLAFPGGETVQPGKSGKVADWESAKKSKVVQTWLEEGTVVEGEATEKSASTTSTTTDEDEDEA